MLSGRIKYCNSQPRLVLLYGNQVLNYQTVNK